MGRHNAAATPHSNAALARASQLGVPPEEQPTTERVPTPIMHGLFAAVGLALGGVTVVTLSEMYPPRPGPVWLLLPAVAATSLLVLLAIGAVLYRRVGELATQWFVVGYAVAMLLWGSVLVGEQTVAAVRDRIPSTLGVAGV
jgi:hypothetical protein